MTKEYFLTAKVSTDVLVYPFIRIDVRGCFGGNDMLLSFADIEQQTRQLPANERAPMPGFCPVLAPRIDEFADKKAERIFSSQRC
jgi:hypothetical protein